MKALRFTLFFTLLAATSAFAQSGTHDHKSPAQPASADAQAFEKLKSLAGSWTGQLTTTPEAPGISGSFVQFAMRVTSRGNAVAHEFSVSGLPDHPVTMFYLDEGRLTMTHYCDAGNRPRMTGKLSPDGNTLEFDLVDLSGGNQTGHMHRVVFNFLDDTRHTEEWTYMMPGDKPVRATFQLQRTNF